MPKIIPCGCCGHPIYPALAEVRFYCSGYLCAGCWERYGHCGHIGADLANLHGRMMAARQSIEKRRLPD